MNEIEILAERFEANRAYLRAVAYRMLGSRTEAEDAVQEAWLRLSRAELDALGNLRGWLTTVIGRVCLDFLRNRKMRREEAIGEEAEALSSEEDPERDMALADSVGTAMLAVLDMLSPAERVAFVLHDLFNLTFETISDILGRSTAAVRQLASRARRRVQGRPPLSDTDRRRHDQVVTAFLAASRGGDFSALLAVLDPDAVLRADEAAMAGSATRASQGAPKLAPGDIQGHEAIAKLFLGRAREAQLVSVDGCSGVVVPIKGEPIAVFEFVIEYGVIVEIAVTANAQAIRAMELEY